MQSVDPTSKPPDPGVADWRLGQIVADTHARSKVGGFLYVFGWAVICGLAGAQVFAPVPTVLLAIAFFALALWRLWMRPPPGGDREANRRWLRRYALVLPLASLLWAGVQAWVLLDARFDAATRMVSLVATIGYATVFANVYSTVRHLAAAGVGILFLPMLVVLWGDPGQRPLAVALSFYALYLVGAVVRSHAEYRRRLGLDQALREQRDQFEQLSRTDPLTGVCNRRHFSQCLEAATRRAAGGGEGVSLLILDIDHFKRVNDRHGHAVGDACLRALAQRLQRAFPEPHNLAARLGGEEFGVLIDGDDEVAARRAAEVFRRELAAAPLDADGQALEVTTSIGIGRFDPSRHKDGDGLYRAVDQALYAAKDAGRNRVLALSEPSA